MHLSTLSVNSMAGFPKTGNLLKSAMTSGCAGPVSLSRTFFNNKGPGRISLGGSVVFRVSEDQRRCCTVTQRC
jgi:hypothetical protein